LTDTEKFLAKVTSKTTSPRKKVLTICTDIPSLNAKGYQVLAYHRLLFLNKYFDVTVICFGSPIRSETTLARESLEEKGIQVICVKHFFLEGLGNVLKSLVSRGSPLQVAFFKSRDMRYRIKECLEKDNYEFIHLVMVRVADNIPRGHQYLVVELVDSMGLNFTRKAEMSGFLLRSLWSWEALKILGYEKKLISQSAFSTVVSQVDKEFMGLENVEVLPLGVELPESLLSGRRVTNRILFTGNMGYQPNEIAVTWFIENCWETIKAASSSAEFYIAGSSPSPDLVKLAEKHEDIVVTGWVESMSAVFEAASLAVAPMQSGSGMQFKILEAMAHEVPVVTTILGKGDIRAKEGVHLIVADDENFSEMVISLLNDFARLSELGSSGKRYVVGHHSWESINKKFLAKIDSLDF
jgi:glycosyltransferase involved in cell wall biosynthesis